MYGDGIPVIEQLQPGQILCSPVTEARFLVRDPGAANRMPTVNNHALVPGRPPPCSKEIGQVGHCDFRGGRHYLDPMTGLTLLCIWPGRGSLCYEGRPLADAPEAASYPIRARVA